MGWIIIALIATISGIGPRPRLSQGKSSSRAFQMGRTYCVQRRRHGDGDAHYIDTYSAEFHVVILSHLGRTGIGC